MTSHMCRVGFVHGSEMLAHSHPILTNRCITVYRNPTPGEWIEILCTNRVRSIIKRKYKKISRVFSLYFLRLATSFFLTYEN